MTQPGDMHFVSTLVYLLLILISAVISIWGSIMLISFLTRRKINEKTEIVENRNIGVALVLGAFIWTLGRMCLETIRPIMNAWYNQAAAGFQLSGVLRFLGGTLGSLAIALIFGALTVYLSLKILMIITQNIDEWEEIRSGNTAIALIISITVLVVGTFFESVISSIVISLFAGV